jgi:hypothetical protein
MIGIGIGIPFGRRGGIDKDAAAFIAAAGITDATQKAAINRLVKNYKGIGDINTSVDLWTGSSAIYPIVGGSATQHKFNLKNPLDDDAAFRLAFSGGWTHSTNGALPNGTNAFADTFLKPNQLGQNNACIGFYSRTNNTRAAWDIAASGAINSFGIASFWDLLLGNLSRINIGFITGYIPANSLGFFLVNRILAASFKRYQRGVLMESPAGVSGTPANFNIYLGANNNAGTAAAFSNREMAFVHIGAGITSDANSTLLNDIVEQFQTDLGRAV